MIYRIFSRNSSLIQSQFIGPVNHVNKGEQARLRFNRKFPCASCPTHLYPEAVSILLYRLNHDPFPTESGLFRINFAGQDRKSTRLNSSHVAISYAVFCLKKKNMTVEIK